MKRNLLIILTFIAMLVFVSCGRDTESNDAKEYDTNINDCANSDDFNLQNDEHIYRAVESTLEGEITILVPIMYGERLNNNDLLIYARLFNELHPHVSIKFEGYRIPFDMSQHTALTTRLLADPPDLLSFLPAYLSFEKMRHEVVFANLYNFFDGPRGIDLDDYFSNIFRAAEIRRGLFHMPLYVSLEMTFLNRRLFEGIGVDVSEISTITIDEELDFYFRITEAFPDEDIFYNREFSIYQILMRQQLYDIETGIVLVDTPQVRQRFELAMQIPMTPISQNPNIPGGIVTLFPGGPGITITTVSDNNASAFFLTPTSSIAWPTRYTFAAGEQHIIFLGEHPNMQFSKPVFMASGDEGNFRFTTMEALAVMQYATNQDLAWEFLRFIMEFEDSMDCLLGTRGLYHATRAGLPVNRTRFENQVGATLSHNLDVSMTMSPGLWHFVDIPLEEHRTQTIDTAMEFYRRGLEKVNYEIQRNAAVIFDLVYPDIWLLYSGQQDIPTTLANIQNRLELYVHE